MAKIDAEITEDYFIVKGINSFLDNPDAVDLDRMINNKNYIDQTLKGKTRVSYMSRFIKSK